MPGLSCQLKSYQSTKPDRFAFNGDRSQSLDTNNHEWDIFGLQKIIHIVSSPKDQLIHKELQHRTLTKQMQATPISGQMIDYIARKESWYMGYSVVDSKRTRFWVPRNKTTDPLNQQG